MVTRVPMDSRDLHVSSKREIIALCKTSMYTWNELYFILFFCFFLILLAFILWFDLHLKESHASDKIFITRFCMCKLIHIPVILITLYIDSYHPTDNVYLYLYHRFKFVKFL